MDMNKMNACRYTDKSQGTGQLCGKPEECKNEDEGCNGSEAQKKIGQGICGKLDNGMPTEAGQTGCASANSIGSNRKLAWKCKSGYACGGYCSCNPNKNTKEEGGCDKDTEYCDWWTGHTRKCQPLRDNDNKVGSIAFI